MSTAALDLHTLAPIGHNLPPLADQLVEETIDLKRRAEALAEAADRATVTDDDTAGKAALLVKMMRDHRKVIDDDRVARKAPYLEAGRAVDAHFAGLAGLVATLDGKGKVVGGPEARVAGLVDEYRREQERKAAAERARLEEEARQERLRAEAAARAQREAEERARRDAEEAARKIREAEAEAARAGDKAKAEEAARLRAEQEARDAKAREDALKAEIAARAAQDAAEALERQAAATKAGPIDSGFGAKASGRTTWKATITDLTAALKHARKVDEARIRAAVQEVYDRQVKAGVRELPGADVIAETTTIYR